jgi:hypothetical protein
MPDATTPVFTTLERSNKCLRRSKDIAMMQPKPFLGDNL